MRVFSFLVAVGFLASTQVSAGEFCLVREGVPLCSIVIGDQAGPAVRLASLELQFHILQATGAELPVVNDSEPHSGPRILVGDSQATRSLGIRGEDFKEQEYLISFRGNDLLLIGRDWADTPANRAEQGRGTNIPSLQAVRHKIDYWACVGLPGRSEGAIELPGLFDDQGTCYAVYDFLERFCGIRWYGPSPLNVVIPARQTLIVRGDDVRRSPALKHRDAFFGGGWPFMRGQWDHPSGQACQLYWRRLRLGGLKWAGNHTFHRSTVATVFTDPEYQAVGPGNGSQLCYTHPKLVAQVVQMARDYFDGKGQLPEGWRAMGDYFAIVPDDNSNWCRCENCKALLEKGRGKGTGFFSSGEVSDYWYHFVNAVAREVAKTHPDKYIATLAYWCYAFPPSDGELEPNVSIAPCLHTCYYGSHQRMRDNDMAFYKQWLEITDAPMFMWAYYHHPMEAALIQQWKCFPNFMVHVSADAMKMFIADGIQGVFMCGEPDQLEYYIVMKLWDDPSLDVDDLIDEFFTAYFGAAAQPMKNFYELIESTASNPASYPDSYSGPSEKIAWEYLGTTERMLKVEKAIGEAEQLTSNEIERRRVATWKDAIWKWMDEGRSEYLEKLKR